MIQLTATGNLGHDAKIVEKEGSPSFCSFSMAIDDSYTNKEGTKVERTIWLECIINDTKKPIIPFLKTGQKVLVQGRPKAQAYKDKDGNAQAKLQVNVTYIELLGKASDNAGNATPSTTDQPAAETPATPPSDDLPF